jgi:hypothetical protein
MPMPTLIRNAAKINAIHAETEAQRGFYLGILSLNDTDVCSRFASIALASLPAGTWSDQFVHVRTVLMGFAPAPTAEDCVQNLNFEAAWRVATPQERAEFANFERFKSYHRSRPEIRAKEREAEFSAKCAAGLERVEQVDATHWQLKARPPEGGRYFDENVEEISPGRYQLRRK